MKPQFINKTRGSVGQKESRDQRAKTQHADIHQSSLFKAPFSPSASPPIVPAENDRANQSSQLQAQGLFAYPSARAQKESIEEFAETLPVNVPDYPQRNAYTGIAAASTSPTMGGTAFSTQHPPLFQNTTPPGFAPPPPGFFPPPPGFAPPVTAQTWSVQPTIQTPYTPQQAAYPEEWAQPAPSPRPPNIMQAPPVQSAQPYGMPYAPGPQARSGQRYTPPIIPPLPLPKKRGLSVKSRILLGTLVILLALSGGGYAYYQANYANSISNITNQQVIHHNAQGEVVAATPGTADILTGNRLNILLLGSDTDGKSIPLAQTDIVVTIDPQTKYVGMLSIPRDLRLYAPKAGAIKLDEAFSTGWALPGDDHYGNAVGLSIDTIEQNFGIPINYSAWVGLDGFVKVIDTVGGIDVNVLHPMVDDIYPNDVNNQSGQAYDYKRLYIAPGPQHLDGIHALEYVRTRHSDGQADFGRAVRQQQILSQLKNKLTQLNINQLPALIQDLNGHVKTDMQLTDIPKLLNFARSIDPNTIDKLVLSQPYSVPASSVFPKDSSTDYIPVCSQIIPKIQQMFDLGTKATCPTVGARYSFPQADSTTSTGQTATVPTPQVPVTTTTTWQMLGTPEAITAKNLPLNTRQETSNIHNILDLMFMTVFQSLDAART